MRPHIILLVTVAVAICNFATPTTASGVPGGWTQISDINAPKVQEIASWAVAEHARRANDGLRLKLVVSGMQQLVSGRNWKLRLEAVNSDGGEGVYVAEVYDQSWTHTRRLISFGPAN